MMTRLIWNRQTLDDGSASSITVHHDIWPGTTSLISSTGGRLRLMCLLTLGCLATLAPPSVGCLPPPDVRGRAGPGIRHPSMLHSAGYSMSINGGKGIIRRGMQPAVSSIAWPSAAAVPSSVDENVIDETADGDLQPDAISVVEDDQVLGSPSSSIAVAVPRPDERRTFLPHLLGPSASGGVRKMVTTGGMEEDKRWAPTEIRMNEFIHKIQAVNQASRYNRRLSEPASNDYEWWARRVRRQRLQQTDGAKAAQALKLYGLRTRMGLEE